MQVLICLVMLLVATVASASEPFRPVTDPAEEDLRLLQVTLDQIVLADVIAGYAGPAGGTLLPLQGMSELAGIAITVSPAEGLARGFVLNERRTFHLDVGRREVTIAGRTQPFNAALVRVHLDDIYVDSALLGEWLPISFDVDLFALRVRLRPREPLPLQTRLDRERRIRLWRLRLSPPDPGYPRLATPYRLWEMPFIDQRLRLFLGESSSASYATYATGDLLFMESEAFLSGRDDDPFDTTRLTLRRRDPEARIGRWLSATEVAVGSVIHPASSLLSTTSDPLPGFLLTNRPLTRATEFDRHAFRGNLPPGWDVELYHNDALIDYQQAGPEGEYFFADVPILIGMNFFRLVFHGPQGQRREEEYRFLLGESLTLPGRFDYLVVANVDSSTERRGSAVLSYGINRHLTANAEISSLPTPLGERQYGKVGLRTFRGGLFAYGDLVQDDLGTHAWEAGMQTRLFGVNVLLNRQELSEGFVSEAFRGTDGSLRSRDRARFDTAIPASVFPRIPISLELERQTFASGSSRTLARNRLSTHYKGLSLTNRLTWSSIGGDGAAFDGSFQLSRSIRRTRVRGELVYTIDPGELTAANIVLERSLASGYRIFATVGHSLIADTHVYSIGFDKTTGSFAAGMNASRNVQGDLGSNIELAAGIGHDPREGTWQSSARSRARFGAASVRVFLDLNENGRFDAGDQPLADAGLTVNGVSRFERTGRNGVVFIPELVPHLPANLALDSRTLDDPQWVADVAGLRVMPRPGKTVAIDMPVVQTSEIEGTVYVTHGDGRQAVGGAVVELLDAGGEVVRRTTTAYDGFFVLTHVRRGGWRVRVDPANAAMQVAFGPPGVERRVMVTTKEPVISGFDITLPGGELSPQATPTAIAEQKTTPAAPLPPGVQEPPAAASAPQVAVEESGRSAADYVVQLGSFSVPANATRLVERVRRIVPDATISREGEYSVVRSGRRTHGEALALTRQLANHGFEALVLQAGGTRRADVTSGSYVVQLGAFSIAENARNLAARVARELGNRAVIDRSGSLYIVRTEPFPSRAAARAVSETLRSLGFEGLVREHR